MDATDTYLPVFLLGATACGKTAIAMELIKELPCEIVSVDSALIYRLMNIGTAKPDRFELEAAPHRLIDIIDPWETYSVSRFVQDAHKEIMDIQSRGKIPLMVGGTMMYFKALEYGLSEMPAASSDIRLEIENQARQADWAAMHRELTRVDPNSAQRIHPNDPQRIQRALEIWRTSGRSMTDWHKTSPNKPYLHAIKFGLFPEHRRLLHERIAGRFYQMLEKGFIDEVDYLRSLEPMRADLPSMRSVGYRQVWNYLDGLDSKAQMTEKGIAATRQLAKRQITWMRKMANLTLFDSGDTSINHIVRQISNKVRESFGL